MSGYQRFNRILEKLEIQRGDLLYVHTSFKRIASLGLTAEQLIETLTGRLGSTGTLVLPAFGWNLDKSQRPWKAYRDYFEGEAVFDVRNTPANIGYVPEVFRGMPDVTRSVHYWYSICARGPLATELTTGQERVPHPWGPGSSFDRLRLAGVKILGLGVSLNTTSLSLTTDYALGAQHPQQVFTDEPRVGAVINHEGQQIATHSFWLLPEAVRLMRPGGVIDASAGLRRAIRRADEGETFYFVYPYHVYHEESVRLGVQAAAEVRPVPWLVDYPLRHQRQRAV